MIRLLDVVLVLIALSFIWPLLIVIMLWIWWEDGRPVLFQQERIGQYGVPFNLLKFRTMVANADKQGQLTVGADRRITKSGKWLRKYKFDELPQLINVLKGEMSLVGPRPEVAKYVNMYNDEQRLVLNVRPGITDEASIAYFDENEILGKSQDPERTYIEDVMPRKLELNQRFVAQPTLGNYFRIIFKTIERVMD